MRELKFRAWSEKWHEMTYFNNLYWFEENGVDYYKGEPVYGGVFIVEVYTIEQFTGHYDKNGRDIYEGDIVRSIISGNTQVVRRCNVLADDDEIVSVVGFGFIEPNTDELEVIGNIHENEELLHGQES